MNLWIIASVIVGLLIIGGVAVVNAVENNTENTEQIECSTCGNSCTAESNCGLSTCGAISGGSCGCRG